MIFEYKNNSIALEISESKSEKSKWSHTTDSNEVCQKSFDSTQHERMCSRNHINDWNQAEKSALEL